MNFVKKIPEIQLLLGFIARSTWRVHLGSLSDEGRVKYRLFSSALEVASYNLTYLQTVNPDFDSLGFSIGKISSRILIERSVDYLNYSDDPRYIKVLEFYDTRDPGDYGKYLFDGDFTILSKLQIANYCGKPGGRDYYQALLREYNRSVHGNLKMPLLGINDIEKKEEILRELLGVNIQFLCLCAERFLLEFAIPFVQLDMYGRLMIENDYHTLKNRILTSLNGPLIIYQPDQPFYAMY